MHLIDKRKLKNAEYLLPIFVLLISVFGLLAILLATASPATGEEPSFAEIMARLDLSYVKKQAMWLGVGIFVFAVVSLVDYRFYRKIWYIVLGVPVVLILLVSLLGITKGGTTGWFEIGVYTFQPTEMGKLAMIILLANTLTMKEELYTFKDLLPSFAIAGAFLAVLLYQMDLGTTLVYVFVFFCMLFIGGAKWKHILPLIFAGVAAAVAIWFIMGPNQQARIIDYFSGSDVAQLAYSKIAIGSGQLTGKGFLSAGSISQMDYIYAVHTDFIFAAIGESFGFLGSGLLIGLYIAMIVRMWILMRKVKDRAGALIIAGIMCMFMFHIFENIGMTMGVMPITGIPLPFVSYGGSSFLTNMIGMGLVESIALNRPIPIFGDR